MDLQNVSHVLRESIKIKLNRLNVLNVILALIKVRLARNIV
jgi:hypothetical protein